MEHPRFGYIMGLVASRDIAVGEEITVNYNYSIDDEDEGETVMWYRQAYKGEKHCLS